MASKLDWSVIVIDLGGRICQSRKKWGATAKKVMGKKLGPSYLTLCLFSETKNGSRDSGGLLLVQYKTYSAITSSGMLILILSV